MATDASGAKARILLELYAGLKACSTHSVLWAADERHEPAHQGLRQVRFNFCDAIAILARVNSGFGINHGESFPVCLRDAQFHPRYGIANESVVNRITQGVEPNSLHCGNVYGVCVVEQRFALAQFEQIDLVHHVKARLAFRFKLSQNGFNLRALLIGCGTGRVGNMEQQRRLLHFLEGGAECRDKRVGQVANESDGVRNDHLAFRGQL